MKYLLHGVSIIFSFIFFFLWKKKKKTFPPPTPPTLKPIYSETKLLSKLLSFCFYLLFMEFQIFNFIGITRTITIKSSRSYKLYCEKTQVQISVANLSLRFYRNWNSYLKIFLYTSQVWLIYLEFQIFIWEISLIRNKYLNSYFEFPDHEHIRCMQSISLAGTVLLIFL